MGKEYFELMEKNFCSLTREIQKALAREERQRTLKAERSNSISKNAPINNDIRYMTDESEDWTEEAFDQEPSVPLPRLFEKSWVVYHKMFSTSRNIEELQERAKLYHIQLKSLQQFYREINPKGDSEDKRPDIEITFRFADDADEWILD